MTCHDVANHIHEYVDHTLPPGARHGVGEHLATCAGCDRTAREIRCLIYLLRMLPRHTAPDTLKHNLLAALHTIPWSDTDTANSSDAA